MGGKSSVLTGVLLWYMLPALSTSARPPILYGRSRPIAGELPYLGDVQKGWLSPGGRESIEILTLFIFH